MANMHLVTGFANKEHIKAADQGSFNAALLGEGEFVLERGSKFAYTIISNNLVRIKDGDIIMQGRHEKIDRNTYVDMEFENGQQGYKRNDLIVVRYTKDSASGIEEANLVVLKGTPTMDDPTDPEIQKGDILDGGALVNEMPLYRVPFDGLNIQDLVCLFEVLPSWKTLKAQSIEETQKALDERSDAEIEKAVKAIEDTLEGFDQKGDTAIEKMQEQVDEIVKLGEEAIASVPAVKTGTTDPTKSTVGILGQIYINTISKKMFHCVDVEPNNYDWISEMLPELLVITPKEGTVTVTNGVITYSAPTNGKVVFTIPNFGKWTISATIDGMVFTKTVEVTELKQIKVSIDYQIMTAIIDLSNSNPNTCITYADDAVGMTAEDWDSFFGHYPVLFKDGEEVGKLDRNNFTLFEDGSSADIESGENGDVMIAFPRRGLKMTKEDDKIKISFTNNPNDAEFKYYAHQRGNVRKDIFYIGAFKGWYDGTSLRSLSGKTPTANITIGTARTYAQNNGDGYEQSAFYQLMYRQCAYVMKFGSLDAQTKIGMGFVYGENMDSYTRDTGETNAYGMDCEIIKQTTPEYMTDGLHSVKCFGIEDFWGAIFEWIDGIVTDSSDPINILTNTDNFQDDGMGEGYMITSSGLSSDTYGYMSEPQGNTETGFTIKEKDGSSTTYFANYAELNGGSVAGFGGGWVDGADAGAFCLYVRYRAGSSDVHVSARLMYL